MSHQAFHFYSSRAVSFRCTAFVHMLGAVFCSMLYGLTQTTDAVASERVEAPTTTRTSVVEIRTLGAPAPRRLPELAQTTAAASTAPTKTVESSGALPEPPCGDCNAPGLKLIYLGTTGLPETSLARIASDLGVLRRPFTIRGLPWKPVQINPERRDVVTHETTLEALSEPFFRAGTAIYVDPRPFEALEAVVDDLPLPAWLLTNGNETEVLPGDVSPLWALGDLLSTTQSEVLRDALFNQLREEGLLDEVLAAHH